MKLKHRVRPAEEDPSLDDRIEIKDPTNKGHCYICREHIESDTFYSIRPKPDNENPEFHAVIRQEPGLMAYSFVPTTNLHEDGCVQMWLLSQESNHNNLFQHMPDIQDNKGLDVFTKIKEDYKVYLLEQTARELAEYSLSDKIYQALGSIDVRDSWIDRWIGRGIINPRNGAVLGLGAVIGFYVTKLFFPGEVGHMNPEPIFGAYAGVLAAFVLDAVVSTTVSSMARHKLYLSRRRKTQEKLTELLARKGRRVRLVSLANQIASKEKYSPKE